MLIDMAEAQAIKPFEVFGLGIGFVFFGLVCLIILCSIMGKICKTVIRDKNDNSEHAEKTEKTDLQIADKGNFIAAVSAAIAESMGKDVSGIRIISVKKL